MITYADGKKSDVVTAPTESLVAAAFDAKTNRLYYTPMHSNELRYFDLSKGYQHGILCKEHRFEELPGSWKNDVITRMCFRFRRLWICFNK